MRAISLPFRLDGYGNVASSSDMSRIWADRVRTVVSTYPGERVIRPTFGTRLPEDLYEALSETRELVTGQLSESFSAWLPEVEFNGIEIEEYDEGQGTVRMSVNYSVPNIVQDDDNNYSIII